MNLDGFLEKLSKPRHSQRFSSSKLIVEKDDLQVRKITHGAVGFGNTLVVKIVDLKKISSRVLVSASSPEILRGEDSDCIEEYVGSGDLNFPELEWTRGDKYVCSEFFNECAIGHCLQTLAPSHFFLTPIDCWQSAKKGYILLENTETTLEDILLTLSYEEFVQVALQVLLALASVEHLEFKHHDLHLKNICMTTNDVSYSHTFEWGTVQINCGVWARLGNFGFSSLNVHGKRVQRIDVDYFQADADTYGVWSNSYHPGYDIATFLAHLLEVQDDMIPSVSEAVETMIETLGHLEVSEYTRPLGDYSMCPTEFIRNCPLFKDCILGSTQ